MNKFFKQIFQDDKQQYSSKRFLAIIGGLSLIGSMLYYNTENLVSSVLILVCAGLGITSIDRYINKDKNNNT